MRATQKKKPHRKTNKICPQALAENSKLISFFIIYGTINTSGKHKKGHFHEWWSIAIRSLFKSLHLHAPTSKLKAKTA